MNIYNQDIYYDKYLKYKTKYLELKELNGSGWFDLFLSKKDIYGSYYKEFILEINKIKIIKEIKEVIGADCIKEMMKINLKVKFNDHYEKSLEKYFEDKDKDKKKIIQIIKKSNNIQIKDIINVLEDIENILIFNNYPPILILPELYVNFSEKLDTFKNKPIEEYKKKNKKFLEEKFKTELDKQYKEIEIALEREKHNRRLELTEQVNEQIKIMVNKEQKEQFIKEAKQIVETRLNGEYASEQKQKDENKKLLEKKKRKKKKIIKSTRIKTKTRTR